MAEAVFRHMVNEKGLGDKIHIDSCGTAGYHIGKPPHLGTMSILTTHGISHTGIKASQLNTRHLKDYDGIVAMDEDNLSDILRLKNTDSTAWVKLLSDFSSGDWVSVPDPWYTNDFDQTYRLIVEGCSGLLEYIKNTSI
jgi:protein-tyrosine phosphatase